jgi:hypothetical protein
MRKPTALDQLTRQLGDVCGEVAEISVGQRSDAPELREVKAAVDVASEAIRRVAQSRAHQRLPTVLAAWKAIALAHELTMAAREASSQAVQMRARAAEQLEQARQQRARLAAGQARGRAARLERWLERLQKRRG